jgi:hypothetical protein
MQTCWTVGYVIGEIPSNIILTRIRPSIWIPAMEVRTPVCTKMQVLILVGHLGYPHFLPRESKQCRDVIRSTLPYWCVRA